MYRKGYGFTLLCILCIALCSTSSALNPPDNSENNISTTASFQENTEKIPVGILVMQSGFVSDIGEEYERAFEMVEEDHPDSPIASYYRCGKQCDNGYICMEYLQIGIP